MKKVSKKEFRRLIRAGHGRAAIIARDSEKGTYDKEIIAACLRDFQSEYYVGGMGDYVARILGFAQIDLVPVLKARYDSKIDWSSRIYAMEILSSLAAAGDERCAGLLRIELRADC